MTALEDRFSAMNHRISAMEERFAVQEERMSAMLAVIVRVAERLDGTLPPHPPKRDVAATRSGRDSLGMAEKAPVWGAAGAAREAFVRQRQCDVALAGAHGRLGQGPVDDVALCVATTDLP